MFFCKLHFAINFFLSKKVKMKKSTYFEKPVLTEKSNVFIGEMKKLLEEVQNTVKATKFTSSERNFERIAEYYDLLDYSVKDPDVMDLLRIRRQLVDNIKTGKEEVQAVVKEQLQRENLAEEEDLEASVRPCKMKEMVKPMQKPSLLTKQKGCIQLNKTYTKIGPKAVPKLPSVKYIADKIKENQTTRNTIAKIPIPRSIFEQESQKPTTQPSVAERISQLLKINEKKAPLFSSKYQVSPQVSSMKVDNFASDHSKYFPCAVPLGPPNRNKIREISFGIQEQISAPSVTEKTSAVAVELVPIMRKQAPVVKESISLAEKRTVVHKEIVHDFAPCDCKEASYVTEKANSKKSSVNVAVTSKKKLSMVLAHSINIDGSSAEITKRQKNTFSDGISEQFPQNLSSSSGDKKSNSSSCDLNSNNRCTTAQLSFVVDSLTRLREEIRTKRMSDLDHRQIENVILELVHQQYDKEKQNLRSTEMVDVGIQIMESNTELKQNISGSTQTSNFEYTAEKMTQFAFSVPSYSIHTQTDNVCNQVIGSMPQDCNEAIQHNCCHVLNNFLIRDGSNIPCQSISRNCHSVASSISVDLKDAITSTPQTFDLETAVPKVSQSTDTQDLSVKNDDVPKNVNNHPVTNNASSNTALNQESQTCAFKIPGAAESKEAAVQFTAEKPEMICRSTMTQEMENKAIYIQSLAAEMMPKFQNVQPNSSMKDMAIQSDFQDLSLSSTASTAATDDFVDDFLSEGEVPLPWNLRLLSLIDRGVLLRSNSQFTESTTTDEKVSDEPSLSEGEIPTKILEALQRRNSSSNQNIPGSSSSFLLSTDSSSNEFMAPRLLCEQFTDSSKSDLSDGQIPYPFATKLSSTLLSDRENQVMSNSSPDKSNLTKNVDAELEKCHQEENIKNNDIVLANAQSFKSSAVMNSPEKETETCSPNSPSSDDQINLDDLKFSSTKLKAYLDDTLSTTTVPQVSRSPELKTVTEEDLIGSNDNTNTDEIQQLSSEKSSDSSEK